MSLVVFSSLCLWLLAGCASPHVTGTGGANDGSPQLPADTAINPDAGRGNYLVATLRLESGEELLFAVDTGSGCTCLDASLESKLGKPVGAVSIQQWGKVDKKKTYATPKLYLGDTRLRTGSRALVMDLKQMSALAGRPVKGILGMDVLEHYCVQLDFAASKMRFLDGAANAAWGRAFPIVPLNDKDERPAVAGNLFGAEGPHSLIDSGYITDGWLMPQFYRQWTNQAVATVAGEACSPNGRFFGETYPQVNLQVEAVESDGIGLPFLSRHLVTLDFPRKTMYLKRTSEGPLPATGAGAAISYLKTMKDQGQLPGWSKDEHGTPKETTMDSSGNSATIAIQKSDAASIYHYQVIRASKDEPWKLHKAWRTDDKGRTLEEYLVP
jgi:hypothetical protein